MHGSVLGFFAGGALTRAEVEGKDVLEVGSCDVNGSVRPIVEAHGPRSYVGVDAAEGPRVDRVADVSALAYEFGPDIADVVISTEMLEHVEDWQSAFVNLVRVLRPGGTLVVTTRSKGFPYHGHPDDHWRYSPEAMQQILDVLRLEPLLVCPDPDPASPGVFAKARKPVGWVDAADSAWRFLLGAVEGVTPMRKPNAYLGLPFNPDGSGWYRCYLPFQALLTHSENVMLVPDPSHLGTPEYDRRVAEGVEVADVIIRQRPAGKAGLADWQHWHDAGKRLVYECDDDILHPDPSGLPHLFDEKVADSIRECLRLSDLVTVSTEPLAEAFAEYNDNILVLPNMIDARMLGLERPTRARLTVGWAGGLSHMADWAKWGSAIREGIPDTADMHFIGWDFSPVLGRPARFSPWNNNPFGYYETIDFDIGLAPLADTPFNKSKSYIKALEYAALGIPVIASDEPPYRDFVIDGVTGYLVRSEGEWRTRLRELISDEQARAEMGAKAKQHAAGFTIQQHWPLWDRAYQSLLGRSQ